MTADQVDVVEERDEYLGPGASGLYDPSNEREACGVGFIVAIDRKRSHKVCICVFWTFNLIIYIHSQIFYFNYLWKAI